jgi:hypothetical protein
LDLRLFCFDLRDFTVLGRQSKQKTVFIWISSFPNNELHVGSISRSIQILFIYFYADLTGMIKIFFTYKKEIFRANWMFKLVGSEAFVIGKHKCVVAIESSSGFAYDYSLTVDGKSYEKFCENQSKILQAWVFHVGAETYRVVLEKNTMDVWANGRRIDSEPEFVENGTETRFELNGAPVRLVTISSGHRRSGLIHALIVNNKEIVPSNE